MHIAPYQGLELPSPQSCHPCHEVDYTALRWSHGYEAPSREHGCKVLSFWRGAEVEKSPLFVLFEGGRRRSARRWAQPRRWPVPPTAPRLWRAERRHPPNATTFSQVPFFTHTPQAGGMLPGRFPYASQRAHLNELYLPTCDQPFHGPPTHPQACRNLRKRTPAWPWQPADRQRLPGAEAYQGEPHSSATNRLLFRSHPGNTRRSGRFKIQSGRDSPLVTYFSR
jgi:hypothetical protein